MRAKRGSNPVSRAVHRVDHATSRPATAVVVTVLVLLFGVALAIARFPETWETAFAAACAAVTTIVVFTIQHTQSREQAAALCVELDRTTQDRAAVQVSRSDRSGEFGERGRAAPMRSPSHPSA